MRSLAIIVFVALVFGRAASADNEAMLAPVTLVGVPPNAEISVSTMPNVRFTLPTIHLPVGTHVITATAPDHTTKQLTVHVIDQMPMRLYFDMPSTLPPPPPPPEPSTGPWVVIGAGAAIMLTGAAYHVLELEPERDALADAANPAHDPNSEEYAAHSRAFDSRRRITLSLYGLGAATLLGGAVWRFFEYRRSRPEITATPTHDGAMVGMQWQL